MAKAKSKRKRTSRRAATRDEALARVTVDVPKLTIVTLNLALAPPVPPLKHRLLGPPRSGFAFTTEERALILDAAPTIPDRDDHRIPIVDVKLAYLVEDHIERIREFSRRENFKAVARELGAVGHPNKYRRRAPQSLSETVVHILATRLLLRAGDTDLRAQSIDRVVREIRAGEIPGHDLPRAARAARCLGALQKRRHRLSGTTCNEPFWLLASHVFNEWRFGLKREIRLSRDPSRDDGEHHGVHSELVRLTHALHEVAIRRLWYDTDFRQRMERDPLVIMSRPEVFYSLARVRKAMRANDADRTGTWFTVLRRPRINPAVIAKQSKKNLKRLCRDASRARRAAWRWISLGQSSRCRPPTAPLT